MEAHTPLAPAPHHHHTDSTHHHHTRVTTPPPLGTHTHHLSPKTTPKTAPEVLPNTPLRHPTNPDHLPEAQPYPKSQDPHVAPKVVSHFYNPLPTVTSNQIPQLSNTPRLPHHSNGQRPHTTPTPHPTSPSSPAPKGYPRTPTIHSPHHSSTPYNLTSSPPQLPTTPLLPIPHHLTQTLMVPDKTKKK